MNRLNDYQLVKYIGTDDPLALRRGKIYAGRRLKKGWYGIVDETNEEYAYPPELFDVVERDNVRCVVDALQLGEKTLLTLDNRPPLIGYDKYEIDGQLYDPIIVYDAPKGIGFKATGNFKGKTVKFVNMMPRRAVKINDAIFQTQPGIFRLRKTGVQRGTACSYIVTLKKWHCFSLEQRTQSFADCLRGALVEGETLDYSNQCFTVHGQSYAFTYCLEAYRNSAHIRCFVEDGRPTTAFLHRLGYEGALRWVRRNCPGRLPSIEKAMSNPEMVSAYPNPTDRFDQIVREVKSYQKWRSPERDPRIDGEYDPPLPPVNKYPTEEERQQYKQICRKYGIQINEDI